MRKVFICSPLSAPTKAGVQQNLQRARALCYAATLYDEDVAVFAPHVHYTQFLDDNDPLERAQGISAGLSFLEVCDEIWVYTKAGISEGMKLEIERASREEVLIVMDPECFEAVN